MKITDICESTTSGSVATVAAPMNGGPLKRSAVGKGVYGKEPAGSFFTGKKTSKPFANSKLNESDGGFQGEPGLVLYIDGKPTIKYADLSREKKYSGSEKKYFDINKAEEDLEILKGKYPTGKFELKSEVIKEAGMPSAVIKHKQKLAGMNDAELADHLKDKSDDELKQMAWRHGYGKSSLHYVNRVNKGKKINESELQETDLIIVPGQGHRLKSGFISHAEDRRDHEVEMARSDLHQAHKNSSKIHKLIKNVSEDDGLEGWVQAKITKAADYLNSVCQYLEGKHLQEMTGGVIAGGGVGEGINESDVEDRLLAIAKKYPRRSGKPYTGTRVPDSLWDRLSGGTYIETKLGITNHIAARRKALQNLEKDIRYYNPYLGDHSIEQLRAIRSQLHPDEVVEAADHLDEGMGLKQLAAMAAAAGFSLVPTNVGNGERSTADSAYDSYQRQTPAHLIPRYTTPTKAK